MGNIVDARGLRILPFLAQMCHSPFAMKSESFQTMIAALRFTEQLVTSEQRSMRFDNPTMALGGVRQSTWNATMPTEAVAMALLGVTDAVIALHKIQSEVK